MKITRRQLRRIVKESTDVINRDTGEIMFFGDKSYVSDIPVTGTDELLNDIIRRLGISTGSDAMRTYSTGGRDMELPGEDWQKIKDEAGRDSIKEAIGMKITRTQIRNILQEAMEFRRTGDFPDLSHPLIAPYADKMGRLVKGREGKWFVEYQSYSYNAGGQSNQSITVYLLPDGKYTARVGGNFNNTISGYIGKDFDDPESAIEAALNSGPSATGPTAAELLKKVGEKVSTRGYIGQD